MTTWSGPDRDHQPAAYESQPVVEGERRTPAYDRDLESDTGCFADIQHDWLGMPRAYVTEIAVPCFGDGGVQRLHALMKNPEPEPEGGSSGQRYHNLICITSCMLTIWKIRSCLRPGPHSPGLKLQEARFQPRPEPEAGQ